MELRWLFVQFCLAENLHVHLRQKENPPITVQEINAFSLIHHSRGILNEKHLRRPQKIFVDKK